MNSPDETSRPTSHDPSAGSSSTTASGVDNKPATPVPLQRRQELERLLRTNPTNLDAFVELASIYRNENRPVEARRILKQALEVFPDNEDLLYQYEESILARSLQQFREVSDLATRVNTPETDRELSRSTYDWAMRRIEVCRARIRRDESNTQLQVQLAEAHVDAEQFDEAREVLKRVIHLDEHAPAAHLLIARCKLAAGQTLDAMRSLRACAMRRAVAGPPVIRSAALRLLCEHASRLELSESLATYQSALAESEAEIAMLRSHSQLPSPSATDGGSPPAPPTTAAS